MIENNDNVAWWKPAIEIFGQVSAWVAVPVLLSLFIGKSLDSHYGTRPWIFLSLTCTGFLLSSFGIVRTVTTYLKSIDKKEQNGNGEKSNNPKI